MSDIFIQHCPKCLEASISSPVWIRKVALEEKNNYTNSHRDIDHEKSNYTNSHMDIDHEKSSYTNSHIDID